MKMTKFYLILLFTIFNYFSFSQQIFWSETFDVPEKGYWGDGSGNPTGDMSGISKWTLDISACTLSDAADYIKTRSVSGNGRLEAVDINGEAIWATEIIDISAKPFTSISISVSETGTSTNVNKYVKFYYKLNGGTEALFAQNGENIGDFGSRTASQTGISGNTLQIIVRVNNPNAGDACIFDNVMLSSDVLKPAIVSYGTTTTSGIRLKFSEPVQESLAETLSNYSVALIGNPITATLNVDNLTVDLDFASNFIEATNYTLNVSGIADLVGNVMEPVQLNFIFKEFSIKDIIPLSDNELQLIFSHPLNPSSAETEANYQVGGGIGNPSAAIMLNETVVKLTFSQGFISDQLYHLTVNNLFNVFDAVLNGADKTFTYHKPLAFDLIINELMVDVSPAPNVLPAAKYIEIFNRSAFDFDLAGWKIQIGDNTPLNFPSIQIKSNEYLIVCSSAQTTNFNQFGKTAGILSETQLTLSGKAIQLFSNQAELIDYVRYSDTWYGSADKANGGWSLERIDPANFCGEATNWRASTDFKGGTPGKINSVNDLNSDGSLPKLLTVKVLSSKKLSLYFSKNLNAESALQLSNYQLDNGENLPVALNFPDTSRNTIIIEFTSPFTSGQEQSIQIKNIEDFCGNAIETTTAKFTYFLIYPRAAYAETNQIVKIVFSEEPDVVSAQNPANYVLGDGIGNPLSAIKHGIRKNEVYLEFSGEMLSRQNYSIHIEGIKDLNADVMLPADLSFMYNSVLATDLIINEILFNPLPGGVDFVEIYNKSAYPVDLSKISIASRNTDLQFESIKALATENMMFQPSHFLAITTDSLKIKNAYPAIQYDAFMQLSSLPSFNDDSGTAVLLYGDLVLDEFSYTDKMHFQLLDSKEGVSLERIDPERPTQSDANWHSAAESAGFATPANKNSQFRKLSEKVDDELVVEPETFSPNSDGYDDLVFIRYKFNEPGFVANVSIYDARGRLVRKIASNALLAVEGEFFWDGLFTNSTKAPIGIYVIYFEVFNLQGDQRKFKKVCVVADKLK